MIKSIPENNRYLADSETGLIYDTKYNRPIYQWIDNTGYLQCNLYGNGKKVYRRVHRLIAETFIPNLLNLPQVNHINGNKLDNRASNLEYCTNAENTQHAYDNNLYMYKKRSYMIEAYDQFNNPVRFKSIRDFSEKMKLNRKTVSAILNRGKTNNYGIMFKYVNECETTIEIARVIDTGNRVE